MIRTKEELRHKRHQRIKLRLSGSSLRPRLEVRRSLKNLSAQLIDDAAGKVIFSLSTANKELKTKFKNGGNLKAAEIFGIAFAAAAKQKGMSKIVFDRAGFLYHGRIKVFAEALRKGGLEF